MIRSLLVLFSGGLGAQAISFLIMPIVTRLYLPSDIGSYQYVMTLVLISSPLVTLTFHQALIKEKFNNEVNSILMTSLTMALVNSSIICALYYTFDALQSSAFTLSALEYGLLFLLMMSSWGLNITGALCLRELRYSAHSGQVLVNSAIGNSSKVGFGILSPSSSVLLLSIIMGMLASIAWVMRNGSVYSFSKFSFREIRRQGIRCRHYILYLVPSQFISILSGWYTVLVTPFIFGAEFTGILALAIMVVRTPVFPFINSIKSYVLSQCVNLNQLQSRLIVYLKISLITCFISLLIVLFLFFFGVSAFSIIFGESWARAATVSLALSFGVISNLIFYPLYYSESLIRTSQSVLLKVDLFSLILTVMVVFFTVNFNISFLVFIVLSSLVTIFADIMKIILVFKSRDASVEQA